MSGWDYPPTLAGLSALRNAYGKNMSRLVPSTGVHIMEEGWWMALTGAPDPSYNLALVHGGNVGKNVSEAIHRVSASGMRAVVMLAGPGLSGATVLSEAGWVCVGSSSFRALPNTPAEPDPDVRDLAGTELGAARSLAQQLFGVDAVSAALLYSPDSEGVSKRRIVGLLENGVLQAAAMVSLGDSISAVWAGGTHPDGQRRGRGLRVLRQVSAIAFEEVGEGAVCGLASAAGDRLYDIGGAEIVEYWQMWSKPRWLLGS